jgi:hypothetical protein
MERDRDASPFLPVPPAVWAMVLAVLGVEAVLQAGAAGLVGGPEALGWRLMAIQRHGFSGALWQWLVETGRWRGPEALRLLTFPWVQGSGLQAVFVAVLLIALGKAVGGVLAGWAVVALALLASAAGALVHATLWPEAVWLPGGYPAVFGLLGAFAWLAWSGRLAEPARGPRAAALVGLALVLRVAAGLWIGLAQDWIADIAACLTGAGLAAILVPGAGGRLLARLRRR